MYAQTKMPCLYLFESSEHICVYSAKITTHIENCDYDTLSNFPYPITRASILGLHYTARYLTSRLSFDSPTSTVPNSDTAIQCGMRSPPEFAACGVSHRATVAPSAIFSTIT